MNAGVDVRLRTLLLSKVVTRVIKAPSLEATRRHVDPPSDVPVPTRHGDVRCFITTPAIDAPLSSDSSRRPPVHINIHGGAFIIAAPHQDEHIARTVAGEVGAYVVNIDYSTAPKARFPRAVEECFDVLQWVRQSGDAMEWDATRVSIGGGSSGATLALGALQLAHRAGAPTLAAAALIAPLVDATLPPAAYASKTGKHFVTPALIRTIRHAYFVNGSQLTDPLASPLLADLAGLPPTLIVSAEHDMLRAQIERYVKKATASGTAVTYHCFDGVDHDFPISAHPDARPHQVAMLALIRDHLLTHLP